MAQRLLPHASEYRKISRPMGVVDADSALVSGAMGWNCATLSVAIRFGLQCPAVRNTCWLFRSAAKPRVHVARLVPETRWIWVPP